MLLIHSPFTHWPPGVWWMGLQNCLWCVPSSPQQKIGNILSKKMVSKLYDFIFKGDTRIVLVQQHTHVFHNYMCRFLYLDTHWSKVVLEHNRLPGSLFKRCKLGTKCWGLHHVLAFLWPWCGCLSYHLRQPGNWYTSDLVVTMVGIHKYIDVQFIKYRLRKLLINLLTKLCILISKIIFHLKLLIIGINGKWLWVNCIPYFQVLLQVTKYSSGRLNMAYPRFIQESTQWRDSIC